jgi:hypothetical protein
MEGVGARRFERRKSVGKENYKKFHLGSTESPQVLHINVIESNIAGMLGGIVSRARLNYLMDVSIGII